MADVFNDILVAILSSVQPKLYSNIMTATPFLKAMFERGKVAKINGGEKIEVVLANEENQNVMWADFGEVLPTSRNAVVYDWKVLDCTVSILEDEIAVNRDPAKILDLVTALLEAQETSCKNAMATGLFSDGSNPKVINGLQLLIADNPTVGVVGGG